MLNETVTQSHILTPGVEQSFGTLTLPHELTEIIVNANGAGEANHSRWRLYDSTAAGEALIWEGVLSPPFAIAQRLTPKSGIGAGALVELRAILDPLQLDPTSVAVTASLVGYDTKCCAETNTGGSGEPLPLGGVLDGFTDNADFASGNFGNLDLETHGNVRFGDADHPAQSYVLEAETTDATPENVNILDLSNYGDGVFDLAVTILARAGTDALSVKITMGYLREAGVAANLGSPTLIDIRTAGSGNTWLYQLNRTGDAVTLEITGEAATTIEWSIFVQDLTGP